MILQLILFTQLALGQRMSKSSNDFKKTFYSTFDSYLVQATPEAGVYKAGNELYEREKCTTCCRVLFASEWNYKKNVKFEDAHDKEDDPRFVMDMEFDNKLSVRMYAGDYEQNVYLRELKPSNELQYWEFAPYYMYTSFTIPKRVHDIRSSANEGNTLIIWYKKPPLDPGTENQRFIYVHPYPDSYYPEKGTAKTCNKKYVNNWPTYKKHFYLPIKCNPDLCYQARPKEAPRTDLTWTGMKNLQFKKSIDPEGAYQITAEKCVATEPKQMFVPVFA